MIEMVYHLQLNMSQGHALRFAGVMFDVTSGESWFGAVFVFLTGVGLFETARRQFMRDWGVSQAVIEKEIKKREAQ